MPPGQNDFVSTFWYVQVVNEADKANVELVHIKSQTVQNLQIPCYKNTIKLQAGDYLMVYKKADNKNKFADLGLSAPSESSASGKKTKRKHS